MFLNNPHGIINTGSISTGLTFKGGKEWVVAICVFNIKIIIRLISTPIFPIRGTQIVVALIIVRCIANATDIIRSRIVRLSPGRGGTKGEDQEQGYDEP